jgi:hypothetical protein
LSLTGTVYFPSTLEKIQEYSFQNTGFEYFDLSKCASLTSVGGGYGGPFTNNDNMTTLDLSGCTSLTSLKSSFASDCANLTEVILPPNLETIPHKAFAHCYKLQSIVFPASLTYVADEAFHSARRGQENMTFTVYIQSNVQFHATYPFRDSGAKIEYVLIGDGVTLESFLAVNTFASLVNATVVDYTENRDYAAGSVSTHTIVTNYCKSLALSGEHQFGSNPCVVVCSECLLATTKENPEHATVSSVLYENGFGAEGVKRVACTNEGCTYEESTVAMALLVCRGYSASQYGACGIVISYFVNYDAIEEYENVMECDVEYGVFAVAKSNLGDNQVFDKDGVAAQGVISFKTSSYKFVAFELKLTGFETDAQKSTELAMGAYVAVTKGEATEYSYVQFGTPDEGEGYCFDSYNDVMEYLKAE